MKIHCNYTGIKGFLTVYDHALRYRYMITNKALQKARMLAFWEKRGLSATTEAFKIKRRTLFVWKKKLKEAGGKLEGLNDQSKTPKIKRKRLWPNEILAEIKRLRWQQKACHPRFSFAWETTSRYNLDVPAN